MDKTRQNKIQEKARHDNLHKTLRTRQDRTRQKPRLSQDTARQDNLHKTLRTRQDRIRHGNPGLAGIRQDKTTYTRHLGQNKTEAQAEPGYGKTRQPA